VLGVLYRGAVALISINKTGILGGRF
jgi:hypothetical protein